MKTTLQILQEARALISDPNSIGALNEVVGLRRHKLSNLPWEIRHAYSEARQKLTATMGDTVENFNDRHTWQDVIAAWDAAIRCEERAAKAAEEALAPKEHLEHTTA